jgi:hypothetical protein
MPSSVLRRHSYRAIVLAGLAAPIGVAAQARAFVNRLGNDTASVERITKTGDRIEGTIARHLPANSLFKYTVTFNKDGTVATYEQGTFRPDGSPMPPNAQTGAAQVGLKMTFTGDSVIREVPTNGQPVVRRTAVPKGTLPNFASMVFYELAYQAVKRDGKVSAIGFGGNQNAATNPDVRITGTDSAEVVLGGFRTGYKFDRNGQLVHSDGSLTTQKFDIRPARDADITAIASAWAATDIPGQAPTPLSTADTVNADMGGAHITITYGRPAARGREIWGKLVPYDTTWRLGANYATQLQSDKDLDMGGVTVPAGKYTLWLLPSAGPSFLIVNKKTFDAAANRPLWGTGWDPAEDLVRVPLAKHMNLPTAEERLHIFVQGDMLMMHWDKGGYGVKVKAK